MLRGYRGILCALAGLTLSGAAPQPTSKGNPEQPQAKAEPTRAAPDAAADEAADSSVLTKPCQPGSENRNSDLCAQWKAADAASNAALWAMIGTLVAAIGTLGLYWQIYLTRKAVEDTSEATEAMREANSIARSEQRAIIVFERFEIVEVTYNEMAHGGMADYLKWTVVVIKPWWRNVGKMPANVKRSTLNVMHGNQEAKISTQDIDTVVTSGDLIGGRTFNLSGRFFYNGHRTDTPMPRGMVFNPAQPAHIHLKIAYFSVLSGQTEPFVTFTTGYVRPEINDDGSLSFNEYSVAASPESMT